MKETYVTKLQITALSNVFFSLPGKIGSLSRMCKAWKGFIFLGASGGLLDIEVFAQGCYISVYVGAI